MKLFVTFTDKESLTMLRENIERLPESELENCQIFFISYGDSIVSSKENIFTKFGINTLSDDTISWLNELNLSYILCCVNREDGKPFIVTNYYERNKSVDHTFELWRLIEIKDLRFVKLFTTYIELCCKNIDILEIFVLFSKCYDEVENDFNIACIRDIIEIITCQQYYPVFLYKDSEQWDYSIPYKSLEFLLKRKIYQHMTSDYLYRNPCMNSIKTEYLNDITDIRKNISN